MNSFIKFLVPNYISNNERIAVALFAPADLRNEKEIKWNVFRSPANMDEVSSIRIRYCTINFCKRWCKLNIVRNKATYWGFCALFAEEIRDLQADVIYTPEPHPYHSDIKVGHIFVPNEAPPSRIKQKCEDLANIARIFKDPNPTEKNWNGENFKKIKKHINPKLN